MSGSDEITDDEVLLRHIPTGTTWQAPGPRITSLNFRLRPGQDVTGLSVTRQKVTSPERLVEVVGGNLERGSCVAWATAGEVRSLGLQVVPVPLPDDPGHSESQSGSLDMLELATSKLLSKVFRFLPSGLARFRLPEAVASRLRGLLDRQDAGQLLTPEERDEAEGLVDLAEFLTLLRLRAERLSS